MRLALLAAYDFLGKGEEIKGKWLFLLIFLLDEGHDLVKAHRLEGIGVQLRKDVLDLLGQLVHSELQVGVLDLSTPGDLLLPGEKIGGDVPAAPVECDSQADEICSVFFPALLPNHWGNGYIVSGTHRHHLKTF